MKNISHKQAFGWLLTGVCMFSCSDLVQDLVSYSPFNLIFTPSIQSVCTNGLQHTENGKSLLWGFLEGYLYEAKQTFINFGQVVCMGEETI